VVPRSRRGHERTFAQPLDQLVGSVRGIRRDVEDSLCAVAVGDVGVELVPARVGGLLNAEPCGCDDTAMGDVGTL
jgi:hypothetical protein